MTAILSDIFMKANFCQIYFWKRFFYSIYDSDTFKDFSTAMFFIKLYQRFFKSIDDSNIMCSCINCRTDVVSEDQAEEGWTEPQDWCCASYARKTPMVGHWKLLGTCALKRLAFSSAKMLSILFRSAPQFHKNYMALNPPVFVDFLWCLF